VRAAAVEAARDPWVWAPLAGAAGLQINSWDRQISAWAIRETPIFGSQQSAVNWSDDLRSVAVLSHAVTVLLVPSGDDTRSWLVNKAKGYALDLAAVGAANGITHVLKTTVGRTRPSGTNDESFPSGHTTTAATFDRLAARNLGYFDITAAARRRLTYGLDALTIATAWARVEAGAHYPSDTLFSIALGNFSANFFRNAFVESAGNRTQELAVVPARDGLMLRYSTRF
jgi:membrane-associated phospholipid phosphatase